MLFHSGGNWNRIKTLSFIHYRYGHHHNICHLHCYHYDNNDHHPYPRRHRHDNQHHQVTDKLSELRQQKQKLSRQVPPV